MASALAFRQYEQVLWWLSNSDMVCCFTGHPQVLIVLHVRAYVHISAHAEVVVCCNVALSDCSGVLQPRHYLLSILELIFSLRNA